MWLQPVRVKKNVQTYISPTLCLTPEIESKNFRTGECVGIGQTTVFKPFCGLSDGGGGFFARLVCVCGGGGERGRKNFSEK